MQVHFGPGYVWIFVDMVNAVGVEQRASAFDAVYHVAFFQQKFRQVGTVLSGDSGNECSFHAPQKYNMRVDIGFFSIENVGNYQEGVGAICYLRPCETILHLYDIAKSLQNNRLLFKQFSSVFFWCLIDTKS